MKEKKKGRERVGGKQPGGLPMCLAMAFSGGVPVVVGWEFPSARAEREMTEAVFFLADQECPGLEVFPLLVSVFNKFMNRCFYENDMNCCLSLALRISDDVTVMHKHFSREASTGEGIPPSGTGMCALKHTRPPSLQIGLHVPTCSPPPPHNRGRGP